MNISNISPYREPAVVEKNELIGTKYGLIKYTNNPWWVRLYNFLFVEHHCKLPGFFWNKIFGRDFIMGTLFRCKCDKVYQLNIDYAGGKSWIDSDIDQWKKYGGEE